MGSPRGWSGSELSTCELKGTVLCCDGRALELAHLPLLDT